MFYGPLSEEIIIYILSFLPLEDLWAVSKVNKKCRAIVSTDDLWVKFENTYFRVPFFRKKINKTSKIRFETILKEILMAINNCSEILHCKFFLKDYLAIVDRDEGFIEGISDYEKRISLYAFAHSYGRAVPRGLIVHTKRLVLKRALLFATLSGNFVKVRELLEPKDVYGDLLSANNAKFKGYALLIAAMYNNSDIIKLLLDPAYSRVDSISEKNIIFGIEIAIQGGYKDVLEIICALAPGVYLLPLQEQGLLQQDVDSHQNETVVPPSSAEQGLAKIDILSVLSRDMIHYILSFLSPKDLASISRLNKYFHMLGRDDFLWKKLQETYFDVPVSWRKIRATPKQCFEYSLKSTVAIINESKEIFESELFSWQEYLAGAAGDQTFIKAITDIQKKISLYALAYSYGIPIPQTLSLHNSMIIVRRALLFAALRGDVSRIVELFQSKNSSAIAVTVNNTKLKGLALLLTARYNRANVAKALFTVEEQAVDTADLQSISNEAKQLAFNEAVSHNAVDIISILLSRERNLNHAISMNSKRQAFQLAYESNNVELTRVFLLEENNSMNPIDVNAKKVALTYVREHGYFEIMKLLLSSQQLLLSLDKFDKNLCFEKVVKGDQLGLAIILLNSPGNRIETYYKGYALRKACKKNDIAILRILLDPHYNQVEPISDDDKICALVVAAKSNQVEAISVLLEPAYGIINLKTPLKVVLFETACKNGHLGIIKALLSNQNFDSNEYYINSAIKEAIEYQHIEMIKVFIDPQYNVLNSLLSGDKGILLTTAVKYNCPEIVKALLERQGEEIFYYDIERAFVNVCKLNYLRAVLFLVPRAIIKNFLIWDAVQKMGRKRSLVFLFDYSVVFLVAIVSALVVSFFSALAGFGIAVSIYMGATALYAALFLSDSVARRIARGRMVHLGNMTDPAMEEQQSKAFHLGKASATAWVPYLKSALLPKTQHQDWYRGYASGLLEEDEIIRGRSQPH